MTKIELLEMLTNRARMFRNDRDYYKRNSHMHSVTEAPPQEVVDAILTGFINHIGIVQGVDYALYACDLAEEPNARADGQAALPPVRSEPLLACPFCGQLPQIEKLDGFDCVQHINNDCPISPVKGWSLCVWQERHTTH